MPHKIRDEGDLNGYHWIIDRGPKQDTKFKYRYHVIDRDGKTFSYGPAMTKQVARTFAKGVCQGTFKPEIPKKTTAEIRLLQMMWPMTTTDGNK